MAKSFRSPSLPDAGLLEKYLGLFQLAALGIPMAVVLTFMLWAMRKNESVVIVRVFFPCLVVTLVVSLFVSQYVVRRIQQRIRRRLLLDRQPMSDDEFAKAVAVVPKDASLVITARKVMARMCKLDAIFVFPSDRLETLWSMADELGDGDTIPELLMWLSQETGLEFRTSSWHGIITFKDLVAVLPSWVRQRD